MSISLIIFLLIVASYILMLGTWFAQPTTPEDW